MADKIGDWDYNEGCTNTKVTWGDRASLAMKIMSLPARMVYWSSTSFVTAPDEPVFQNVKNRTMGYISKTTSIPQLRIVMPIKPIRVTLKSANRQAKGLNNYNGLFEGSGFSARWIHEVPDRMPEDPVIIYLHGGGYAFKITPPQVYFAITAARALRQFRVSMLVLDYTVTPFGKYPTQLKELAACYNKLTEHRNCLKPILLGDSCGANLALALLQHIKYPVDGVDRSETQAWACGMISPWTSLVSNDHGSYYEFRDRDIIDGHSLDEMCKAYCDESELSDPVVNPIMGTAEYWQGVVPERQFTVWGGNESLRDSCREFAKKAALKNTFEEPKGLHDCILTDLRRPGPQFIMDNIAAWLDPAKPHAVFVDPASDGLTPSEPDASFGDVLPQQRPQKGSGGTWHWTWRRPASMLFPGNFFESTTAVDKILKSDDKLSKPGSVKELCALRSRSDPELTTYERKEYVFEGFSPKKSKTAELKRRLSIFRDPNRALSLLNGTNAVPKPRNKSVPAPTTTTPGPDCSRAECGTAVVDSDSDCSKLSGSDSTSPSTSSSLTTVNESGEVNAASPGVTLETPSESPAIVV